MKVEGGRGEGGVRDHLKSLLSLLSQTHCCSICICIVTKKTCKGFIFLNSTYCALSLCSCI